MSGILVAHKTYDKITPIPIFYKSVLEVEVFNDLIIIRTEAHGAHAFKI